MSRFGGRHVLGICEVQRQGLTFLTRAVTIASLALLSSLVVPVPATASTTLTLRRAFIEKNKDRATITVSFLRG